MNPTAGQPAAARPAVSVILVAHDCESALRRALTAVEASRGRERFEILVVDAGSSDGCASIDGEFASVTLLRLPMNFGKTRARNIGMRTAQADLVFFLDPRVEVQPDTIEKLAAVLEARPDATVAAPRLLSPEGTEIVSTSHLPQPAELAEASFALAPLPRAAAAGETAEVVDEYAVMARKTFVAGMNYLDEKRFSEHWSLLEIFWQVRNAGKRVLLAGDACATLHEALPADDDEDDLVADAVSGAAAYVAKHQGFGAGLSFRLQCVLRALGRAKLGLVAAILAGRRLDPTS